MNEYNYPEILKRLAEIGDPELYEIPLYDDEGGELVPSSKTLTLPPDPEGGAWWGCSESYSGSGRPSRVWEEWTESADIRPDDGAPYPFNGMGGRVQAGPFATRQEAAAAVDAMIYEDSEGFLQWA